MTYLRALAARFLDRLFAPDLTMPIAAVLPSGMSAVTFARLHALGFDVDTTLWLCDFDSLTHQVLRQYDGLPAGGGA